jgi:hypothetical protein
MIYVLLLIVVDALLNLIINFFQGNPGSVIITSAIVRIVCLLLLFTIVGVIVFLSFKDKESNLLLIATTVIVYLLLPLIVYLLKSNEKGFIEVYLDLHLHLNLFTAIYLPYIIASVICIILSNKLKLF